ncbi:SPOR domain-containing protein [Maritalea mobilis]|uniref:SPOR domain-containing protein n=1 Tax=Maritalea mobilis TaxID=483324 RepID=UPI001C93C383|nr:SPOR domain-containing protein [Maritalea mobilis]MBY6199806.1 SPOR domain-containing protein [Maritalea mobilis]
MADIDYFEDDAESYRDYDAYGEHHPQRGASTIGTLVNWAGALVSIGLVVGLGVWGWQLTMRDVSGVPVVRALQGPMRVAPEDPGGTQAPHQGLAVNRLAEGEEAAPVPDQLVLAPPPVQLQELDFDNASAAAVAAPASEPAAAPEPADPSVPDATQALIERLLASSVPLDETPPAAAVTPEEGVEAEIAAAAPQADPAPEPVATPAVTPAEPQFAVIPASVPGVRTSLRPMIRPAGFARAVNPDAPAVLEGTSADVALEVSTPGGTGVREIAPADLPEGTRLVQLGAFDTAEIARSEWERLSSRFPDFMAGRPRVIEEASSGGQRFYRLRAAGFDDLAASRRFCAALVAQGAACIPVTVR